MWRNGGYYRSRRVAGRVVSEYLGRGAAGRLAECLVEALREQRLHQASQMQREGADLDELDRTAGQDDLLAREAAAAALRQAGYHQHKRQWRRKRTVSESATKASLKVPEDVSKAIERVAAGDSTALPALREALAVPGNLAVACRKLGEPSERARLIIAARLFKTDPAKQEVLLATAAKMESDLAGCSPTAIEQALARKAADDWLHMHFLGVFSAMFHHDTILDQQLGGLYRRHLDGAHRRYLSALRTLALVRKLAVPALALQVNVGAQQVNVAGGIASGDGAHRPPTLLRVSKAALPGVAQIANCDTG